MDSSLFKPRKEGLATQGRRNTVIHGENPISGNKWQRPEIVHCHREGQETRHFTRVRPPGGRQGHRNSVIYEGLATQGHRNSVIYEGCAKGGRVRTAIYEALATQGRRNSVIYEAKSDKRQ